jgi:hypothetical protein
VPIFYRLGVISVLRLPDYLGGFGWILSDLSSTASKALANSRRLGGGVPVGGQEWMGWAGPKAVIGPAPFF